MKLSKKKVFALALAVCLIATMSMGTLAWFTAEDEVTNNFLVGDSTTTADKVFGVDVWEQVDTDRDGNLEVIGQGDTTENSATYGLILPGETLTKMPYLTNTGVHDQYARAIVTVTGADTLKDLLATGYSALLTGTDATKWELDNVVYENGQFVFTYYYKEVLEAGATSAAIFEGVAIPTGLTVDQAVAMNNFSVNVLGQVIQAEHLVDAEGNAIDNAKDAFALVA